MSGLDSFCLIFAPCMTGCKGRTVELVSLQVCSCTLWLMWVPLDNHLNADLATL